MKGSPNKNRKKTAPIVQPAVAPAPIVTAEVTVAQLPSSDNRWLVMWAVLWIAIVFGLFI